MAEAASGLQVESKPLPLASRKRDAKVQKFLPIDKGLWKNSSTEEGVRRWRKTHARTRTVPVLLNPGKIFTLLISYSDAATACAKQIRLIMRAP